MWQVNRVIHRWISSPARLQVSTLWISRRRRRNWGAWPPAQKSQGSKPPSSGRQHRQPRIAPPSPFSTTTTRPRPPLRGARGLARFTCSPWTRARLRPRPLYRDATPPPRDLRSRFTGSWRWRTRPTSEAAPHRIRGCGLLLKCQRSRLRPGAWFLRKSKTSKSRDRTALSEFGDCRLRRGQVIKKTIGSRIGSQS